MTDSEAFRTAVRVCATGMLSSDAAPYESALELLGLVSGFPVDAGDQALYRLANLWGELTDRVELRPAEAHQAETHMITAAHEWLAVEGDREAEARYIDRWLDLLRRERPAPSPEYVLSHPLQHGSRMPVR
ncbi:hypothetical protein [Streptomyces sp. NPDC056600]|uniref:hypothetical protein n=1 Tax=Streptomyces sp. NPDC056600 TaxID=3345874 RepID=UPI00369CE00C